MKKTEYMPWNVKGEIRYEEKQKDAYSLRTYDRSSLTTSMISGTFAKYTTADAAQDSARAAKWGVNLGISGSLYGDAYAGADSNTIVSNTDSSVTVKSSAGRNRCDSPQGTRILTVDFTLH